MVILRWKVQTRSPPCASPQNMPIWLSPSVKRRRLNLTRDCAIDPLVDAALLRSHVYPLSQAETVAMETYVSKSLHQGYIRSYTSPVSSSLFFVKKKDGGLRPCIDYRGLNQITLRYSCPLPLIAMAIESMHGARFFAKLDLRSAYNLVRIREGDEWKTAFSTTSGHCISTSGVEMGSESIVAVRN